LFIDGNGNELIKKVPEKIFFVQKNIVLTFGPVNHSGIGFLLIFSPQPPNP
jgi:hypothetical protein